MAKDDLYALDLSQKSSFSTGDGACVEVTHLPGGAVAIRDSKNPDREALRFSAAEWTAFRRGITAGELQG
ncbi:DUF397 domain-containing protein [Streptomyces sp. NPDC002209]|uniref:DUF397 domain-containing protein n=1 Tax=Streptomyces sp. NPDC002209 TaxID=3364638 RepID=UPI0036B305A1